MWAKNVGTAAAQRRRALLHYQVRFFLVNRVWKGVGFEGRFLRHGTGQIGAVRGNAARKNELADAAVFVAVRLRDGLHDASSAGHIDVPHAIDVEHAGTLRVDDKGEVHHGERPRLFEQVVEAAAGVLQPKVHAHKTDGRLGFGGNHVDADDGEIAEMRQEAQSEIAGDASHDDGWFPLSHCWGWLKS